MKRNSTILGLGLIIIVLSQIIACKPANNQVKVVLDNYFNHEFHPKTGVLYHYLWSDTANSGFSEWGKIFTSHGAVIDTLQRAPTKETLRHADVYIIVDPDTKAETPSPNYITKENARVIVKWVKKGGVLVLMANDSGNCEFQHLNGLSNRVGMHFNEVRLSHVKGQNWEMGAITDLPVSNVFNGISKIYMKDVSSLTLSGSAKPMLTKNGNVFMAVNKVKKGYVVAVTDPWIYNEYIGHRHLPKSFENHQAAEHFTTYLLKLAH